MQTKTRSIVVAVVFVVMVIAVWAGGPALWRMFLAMHGVHH
jgi:hypothetical protein